MIRGQNAAEICEEIKNIHDQVTSIECLTLDQMS